MRNDAGRHYVDIVLGQLLTARPGRPEGHETLAVLVGIAQQSS